MIAKATIIAKLKLKLQKIEYNSRKCKDTDIKLLHTKVWRIFIGGLKPPMSDIA